MPRQPLRSHQPAHRRPLQPVRLLHQLDAVFTLASLAGRSSGVGRRRQRQRLALAQRLLDPMPRELQAPEHGAELFWRGLRWGSAGLLLALVLRS